MAALVLGARTHAMPLATVRPENEEAGEDAVHTTEQDAGSEKRVQDVAEQSADEQMAENEEQRRREASGRKHIRGTCANAPCDDERQ